MQKEACKILYNVSTVSENRFMIPSEDCIQQSCAEFQEEACRKLCNLSINDPDKISRSKRGSFQVVAGSMKRRRSETAIEMETYIALAKLIERFPDIKIAITSEGGIQAIVDAMKEHAAHAGVQKEACKVLSNLAVNDNNKIRISIERGINLIISAMKNHITLADVHKEAIKALYDFSLLDENITTISRDYGIHVIIGVMKYHSDHADVQKEACRIMCKLTFQNDVG